MKIHRIELTDEYLKILFSDGIRFIRVFNGLSEDAKLISFGRIPETNTYELLFEAESGVEVKPGDTIISINPCFEDLLHGYTVTKNE